MTGVVLITGGSRGIGAATAVRAARAGWAIGIGYVRDEAAARDTATACEELGAAVSVTQADVRNDTEVVRLFDETAAALGPITGVVNNAGILHRQDRFENFTADRLRDVLEVNVLGAMLVAREAVRHMSTAHGGSGGAIVNVSSAAARMGSPNEYIDYAATKGAMDTMTIGLAQEVARDGIRVNAVRPGLIETEIHASGGEPGRVERLKDRVPMGRGGSADEVAATIMWLLSDDSSYVTGALLDVSGGR